MDLLTLFAVLLAFSSDVLAQAARIDLPTALSYLWIALWGAMGGAVNFYQKVKAGETRWLNLNELFGELLTSGFVGVVTGLLCDAAGAPVALTYAAVGITGHMGGRAIWWMEKALQRRAEKTLGIEKVEDKPKE